MSRGRGGKDLARPTNENWDVNASAPRSKSSIFLKRPNIEIYIYMQINQQCDDEIKNAMIYHAPCTANAIYRIMYGEFAMK